MTYSSLVQNHNALGYYPGLSSALGNSPSIDALPLVSNNASTSFINSSFSSSGAYINNVYDAFYTNFDQNTFTTEFWFSFNNSFNGSGYINNVPVTSGNQWSNSNQYFNVSSSITYNGSTINVSDPDVGKNYLEIIKLINTNSYSVLSKIFYDYVANNFVYRVYGANGTYSDAYIPVRNLNMHFYITATYKAGHLKISVNGEEGIPGYISDYSLWRIRPKSNYDIFYVSWSSVQNSNISFLISDIAFYDYDLTKEHQRRKVVLANHMDKPVALTKELETSMIDFVENAGNTYSNVVLMGTDFTRHSYDNNIEIHQVYGLKNKSVSKFVPADYFPGNSSSVTSNGLKLNSQYSGLQMFDFGPLFNKEQFVTISSQIVLTSTQGGYLFSIPSSVDNQNSLNLKVNSTGASLTYLPDALIPTVTYTYDHFTDNFIDTFYTLSTSTGANEQVLVSVNTPITTSANIGVCFTGQYAFLYVYANSSSITSANKLLNFSINQNSTLLLGNSIGNPTQNNLYIKNFGINNSYQKTFSGYDFSHSNFSGSIAGQFVARFHPNTQYDISQIGYWVKQIDLTNIGNGIVGSKISWDGMDNALVQTSSDGKSWNTVQKGSYIPSLTYNMPNFNQLIRVVVPYEYYPKKENQSFNHLNLALYKNSSYISNDGLFRFTARAETPYYPTGMVRRNKLPIHTRMTNFGISFPNDSTGSVNSYGQIYPTSSSIISNIYSLDFWIKINSGSGSIIDDGLGNKLIFNGSAIYPSNQSATVAFNGKISPSVNILYNQYMHIMYTPSATASSVYINGAPGTQHLNAKYGFMNIWPYSPSAVPSAYQRYTYFVGNNTVKIDQNKANVVKWETNSLFGNNAYNNDISRTSVFAYRIG